MFCSENQSVHVFPDSPILSWFFSLSLILVSVDALHAVNAITSESDSILQKLKEAKIPIHSSIYLKQLCNIDDTVWFFAHTSSMFSMYYIWEMEDDGKALCKEMKRRPMKQFDLILANKSIFSSSVFSVILKFFFIGILVFLLFTAYCIRRGKNHYHWRISSLDSSDRIK